MIKADLQKLKRELIKELQSLRIRSTEVESLQKHLEDVEEYTQEYRFLTKTGDIRWVEDQTSVVRDSDSKNYP